jgi:hypothetical protein
MTKANMIKALKEAEVKVNAKATKAEVEALYNATFNKEEDVMKEAEVKAVEAEVNVINSNEAHVEAEAHVTSLEAEEAKIALMAFCDAHNAKERAEAFYRIATMKLYEVLKDEEGNACKSFKAYVNDFRGGEVYGVKYAMAMHYINLCKYVYPQRACFEDYGTHLLINLIKPLKNEATRGTILEAIDANILNENMTSKEFKEAVNSILGEAKEAEAEVSDEVEAEVRGNGYEVSNTCEVSDEAIDKAVDIMEAFLECNAHDSEVTSAWFTILKALDR